MANLKQIKPTLLTSGVNRTHPALYQVLNQILDFAQGSIDTLHDQIQSVASGNTGGGGSGAPKTSDFLTSANDSATLPNSRQLLAGTNVSFDDTVANQRTINVAASTGFAHQFLMGA